MTTTRLYLILLGLCVGLFTSKLCAQNETSPLTKAERAEVVDSVSNLLAKNYIFPEVAEKIGKHLKEKLAKGEYADITDPNRFADVLTKDVQSINQDKHMRVGFNPEMIAQSKNVITPEDSLAHIERQLKQGKRDNFGFKEVKILEGNIGYLNLTGFHHTTHAGPTASAAMNFLSNADALIIDLRYNGGGSPSMIQLITSYLYGPERVHLNNFYWRPQDQHTQTWTLPYVPGTRRPDMPVYVLTSNRTFSAAEEFSYNLKNLKRATLVGETTGGGAHPGGTRIATERYTVWVPTGRAINPISKTNWEGTGVAPDIDVPAKDALSTAKIHALEKLALNADEGAKHTYNWAIATLKAEQAPITVAASTLKKYIGNYGPRILSFEDGKLYYQREDRPKYALIPMTDELFRIEEIPYFRIKMMLENDQVVGLTGLYDNGNQDKSMRDVVGLSMAKKAKKK